MSEQARVRRAPGSARGTCALSTFRAPLAPLHYTRALTTLRVSTARTTLVRALCTPTTTHEWHSSSGHSEICRVGTCTPRRRHTRSSNLLVLVLLLHICRALCFTLSLAESGQSTKGTKRTKRRRTASADTGCKPDAGPTHSPPPSEPQTHVHVRL